MVSKLILNIQEPTANIQVPMEVEDIILITVTVVICKEVGARDEITPTACHGEWKGNLF